MFFFGTEKDSVLKAMAAKRNGLYRSGWFSLPKLILKSGNEDVEIFYTQERRGTFTRMTLLSTKAFRCEISLFPQQVGSLGIIPGEGVQDILTEDADFDRQFIIQGRDLVRVLNFLNSRIKERLSRLKERQPVLKIAGRQFEFYVPHVLGTEPALNDFVDAGLACLVEART